MTDKTNIMRKKWNEDKRKDTENDPIISFTVVSLSLFSKICVLRRFAQKEQSKSSNRLSLNGEGKPIEFNGIDLNEFKGIAQKANEMHCKN